MRIKDRLKHSRILNFNSTERDAWVEQQAASIPAGGAVLDVGAGTCPYRKLFSHCVYKTQDAAQLQVEQLRDHNSYGAIDYRCDAAAIPVADGAFDAVLCTEVLEHVPEPIKVIAEFARILRPGGKVLLTAPLGSGIHQAPYHYYGGYTPYWYKKFLTEAGFTDIVIQPNGGFFKHYGQESIRMAKKLAPWELRDESLLVRIPLAVGWLLSLPWLLLACPALGYMLDRLDRDKDFTIGYHVIATRSEDPTDPIHRSASRDVVVAEP